MYSGNLYKNFPELYDLLYQRYLKSAPNFVALVKKNTPRHGSILDLAAGTGEITIPLLKSGFKVTSLDANSGMLKQLELKAKNRGVKNFHVVALDMRRMNYEEKFDSICIRQAINYFIGTKSLEKGLKNVFSSIKTGGKFIFNAPNYKNEKTYPIAANYYKKGAQNAFVVETNKMQGKLLKHKQHSIVWETGKKPYFVTDENSFFMFSKKELENALRKCGFSKIVFKEFSKTLYCVATK